MWNLFRMAGDSLHLLSFLLLIMKIQNTRNCLGLSYRTQEIYLVVFLSRYWDVFLYYISLYNTSMKILYFLSTCYIIYLMKLRRPYCLVIKISYNIINFQSYDGQGDDFPHFKFVYPGALLLALIIHTDFQVFEMSWSFSIWLEALAILPQLHMIQKIKDVENITSNYVVALGLYRFFYILSWIQKYYEDQYFCWTSALGGITQTIFYADFLYYFIISKRLGKGVSLPV